MIVLAWVLTTVSAGAFYMRSTAVGGEAAGAAPVFGPAHWIEEWYGIAWVCGAVALGVNMLLRFRAVAPDPLAVAGPRLLHALVTMSVLVLGTMAFGGFTFGNV